MGRGKVTDHGVCPQIFRYYVIMHEDQGILRVILHEIRYELAFSTAEARLGPLVQARRGTARDDTCCPRSRTGRSWASVTCGWPPLTMPVAGERSASLSFFTLVGRMPSGWPILQRRTIFQIYDPCASGAIVVLGSCEAAVRPQLHTRPVLALYHTYLL